MRLAEIAIELEANTAGLNLKGSYSRDLVGLGAGSVRGENPNPTTACM